MFDAPCSTKWLVTCGNCWDGHENFVTDVINNAIKYSQDMADDYFKYPWPPLQQEREIMGKGSTHLKKGKEKAKVRVSWQGE